MIRRFGCLSGLAIVLAGCAASPHSATRSAYNTYWECTSQAVRPYATRMDLDSREAAMRAQARCNDSYQRFRASKIDEVRSKVERDNYDMADQLGAQQALVWRQRVTRRLDDYVRDVRADTM